MLHSARPYRPVRRANSDLHSGIVIALRILFRLALMLIASLAFFGATLIDDRPRLPETPVPDARDVGAVRQLARGMLWMLRQPKAAPVAASADTIEAAARVGAVLACGSGQCGRDLCSPDRTDRLFRADTTTGGFRA